jgi:hypothetical protein
MDVDFDELLFQSKTLTTESSDGSFRKKLRSTLAQPVSQYDPEEKLESSDIEGFMQHHHDMIIFSAIEEGKKSSSADVDAIYRGWASREWNDTKSKMMERLGHRQHRTPHGDASLPSAPRMTSSTTSFSQQSGAGSSNVIGKSSSSSFPALPIGTQVVKSSPMLVAHTKIFRQLNLDNSNWQNNENAPPSPALMISDFDEATLCGAEGAAGTGDFFDASDALNYKNMMFLMSNIVNENTLTTDGRVCGRYAAVAFADDSSKSNADMSHRAQDCKLAQYQLTSGCKNYFQYIFWNYIQSVIDNAFKQGHLSSYPAAAPGHSNRRVLLMYLDIIRKSVGFSQGSVYHQNQNGRGGKGSRVRYCSVLPEEDPQLASSTPLWIFVYYCIRVGELSMAIDELQQQPRGHADDYLDAVLNTLVAIQDQANAVVNRGSAGVCSCASQCRSMYMDLMDEADEQRREHPVSVEPYLLHMLRILSVSDIEIACDNVKNQSINFTSTVEDYMWTNVWYMWLSHLVHLSSAAPGGAQAREGIPDYFEEDFARAVESYGGQAYFDPSYSSPYTFVSVLLCGQRYGEAVMHLWVAGKKFSAIQLSAICLYYGLLLPHMEMPSVLDLSGSLAKQHSCSPVALLLQWAPSYLGSYPMDLVEYLLLCQNDAWFSVVQECCDAVLQRKMCEDANRVCVCMWEEFLFRVLDTGGSRDVLLQLVGSVTSDPRLRDPKRLSDGYLDRFQRIYPSSDYIDRILSSVAKKLLQSYHSSNLQNGVADVRAVAQEKCNNALALFMMTGRYVDVVVELNKQLSNVLASCVTIVMPLGGGPHADVKIQLFTPATSTKIVSNNSYWLNKCLDFYKAYVDGGTGDVVGVLRSENQIEIAKTLEVMLNVAQAFDFYSRDQLQEGLSVCESIGIFPSNVNEVTSRAESYYQMSDAMRAVVPDLLLLSMRAMKSLYDSYLGEKRGNSMFSNRLSSGTVASDADRMMAGLQERSRALYMYLETIRSRGISKPEIISLVHTIAHAIM